RCRRTHGVNSNGEAAQQIYLQIDGCRLKRSIGKCAHSGLPVDTRVAAHVRAWLLEPRLDADVSGIRAPRPDEAEKSPFTSPRAPDGPEFARPVVGAIAADPSRARARGDRAWRPAHDGLARRASGPGAARAAERDRHRRRRPRRSSSDRQCDGGRRSDSTGRLITPGAERDGERASRPAVAARALRARGAWMRSRGV